MLYWMVLIVHYRKVIYQLEKEREKYVAEAADASVKYQQAMEEVKLREMTVLELQKSIPRVYSRIIVMLIL